MNDEHKDRGRTMTKSNGKKTQLTDLFIEELGQVSGGKNNPTTLAIGEEDPMTTQAIGEEDPATSLSLGEEDGPSTRAFGEE